MSEYTQQDLDMAHAIVRAWLEDVKGEAFEQRDRLVKHIAESRASVRAEAQQETPHDCDYFRGFNAGCRESASRLAAAEKLAEAVVAYSVALTRERSFDPETKYQRERAWTLVEDSLNTFREAVK